MADSLTHDDLLAQQKKEKKELMAKTQKMKHSVPKGNKRKKKEITSKIAQMFADLDLKHKEQLKEFEEKNSVTNASLAGDVPKEIFPILRAPNLDTESDKNLEQNPPTGNLDDLSSSSQAENSTKKPSSTGGVRKKMFPVSRARSPVSGKDSKQYSPTDIPPGLSSASLQAENSTNPSCTGGVRRKRLPISRARSPESGKDLEQNSPTDIPHDLPSTSSQAKNSTTNSSWESGVRKKMFPISRACDPESGKELEQNSRSFTREELLAAYYRDKNANALYIRSGQAPFEREHSPESGKHSEQSSPTYNPYYLGGGPDSLRTDDELIGGIPREIFPILRASSPDSGKDSMSRSPPGTRVDLPSPSSQDENSRTGIIQQKNHPRVNVLEDMFPEPYLKTVKDFLYSGSDKETEQNTSAGNPDDLPSTSSKKLTRAQKRRIKKSQKQKEREKAIADQDAINLLGCRETETAAISKKLAERQLSLFEIPSDGNCLYRAIEHQLAILNIQNVTAKELRQLTATYLLSHRQDFTPFLVDPDTGNYMTFERYVKYCNDIVDANTWGGHIEVCALSKIFGKPIEIIQADRDITIGDESASPKLTISYHRNLYRLGAHYNSVVPADISM